MGALPRVSTCMHTSPLKVIFRCVFLTRLSPSGVTQMYTSIQGQADRKTGFHLVWALQGEGCLTHTRLPDKERPNTDNCLASGEKSGPREGERATAEAQWKEHSHSGSLRPPASPRHSGQTIWQMVLFNAVFCAASVHSTVEEQLHQGPGG